MSFVFVKVHRTTSPERRSMALGGMLRSSEVSSGVRLSPMQVAPVWVHPASACSATWYVIGMSSGPLSCGASAFVRPKDWLTDPPVRVKLKLALRGSGLGMVTLSTKIRPFTAIPGLMGTGPHLHLEGVPGIVVSSLEQPAPAWLSHDTQAPMSALPSPFRSVHVNVIGAPSFNVKRLERFCWMSPHVSLFFVSPL